MAEHNLGKVVSDPSSLMVFLLEKSGGLESINDFKACAIMPYDNCKAYENHFIGNEIVDELLSWLQSTTQKIYEETEHGLKLFLVTLQRECMTVTLHDFFSNLRTGLSGLEYVKDIQCWGLQFSKQAGSQIDALGELSNKSTFCKAHGQYIGRDISPLFIKLLDIIMDENLRNNIVIHSYETQLVDRRRPDISLTYDMNIIEIENSVQESGTPDLFGEVYDVESLHSYT